MIVSKGRPSTEPMHIFEKGCYLKYEQVCSHQLNGNYLKHADLIDSVDFIWNFIITHHKVNVRPVPRLKIPSCLLRFTFDQISLPENQYSDSSIARNFFLLN